VSCDSRDSNCNSSRQHPKYGLTSDRLYRSKTISALGKPLEDEIKWLNPTALKHLKNYQIWHHRQTIIDALGSPDGEAGFVAQMLEKDEKNYHVWSYRQWLVKRFNLFDKPEELEWTESMIESDVRNNSAWNHRYYLVFGGREGNAPSQDVVQREIEYVVYATTPAFHTDIFSGTPRMPSAKHHRTRAHGII
jgi:protein farnesyltransferase/geranylgeranyltransferase type-1 subunit alpha